MKVREREKVGKREFYSLLMQEMAQTTRIFSREAEREREKIVFNMLLATCINGLFEVALSC
jgi:hypothetical protein